MIIRASLKPKTAHELPVRDLSSNRLLGNIYFLHDLLFLVERSLRDYRARNFFL